MTVVEIHPVGYGYEPNYFVSRTKSIFRRYRHAELVKLEVVCADRDTDRLVELVRNECRTERRGDGMIFIAEIVTAVRIRDGAIDEAAL